jgi:Bromodomain
MDTDGADGLPPFSWSLTSGNRKKSREEMESLVLKEQIDISLEGDRWTWHESECEKLLKALRHQSDLKYMTFFIAPNYPHDYAAYISKPMDWERVQRTLKKRQYHLFGDFIEDLRLIFSNALKYNSKHQGIDNVSGRAYEAAKYMSIKLEVAISKLLLTVSDRLERERIDHTNAEREIDAAERAEEAQIRATWKKETSNTEGGLAAATSTGTSVSQKIRNIRRVEQNTDFEIPFFDEEDDGQHESSYFEVVKFQKAMFAKQRQELLNMRKASKAIGSTVIARLVQCQMAKKWADDTRQGKTENSVDAIETKSETKDNLDRAFKAVELASPVLDELQREGRGKFQISLKNPKAKRKRPLPKLNF